MSSEAMAVVVGVVCGVLAGIPTSVLMLVAMRARDRQGSQAQSAQPPPHHYPPVIVVNPGGQQQLPSSYHSSDTPAQPGIRWLANARRPSSGPGFQPPAGMGSSRLKGAT